MTDTPESQEPGRRRPILAVVGPTACGKTRRAVQLARAFGGEVISADSRQVYRGMDLGTGKDLGEYGEVPVHLLDLLPAGEKYNLHMYLRDFCRAEREVRDRGRLPILCGGTGMYVEAALDGLRLPEVGENPQLRRELEGKSLEELKAILASMKRLHNNTDTDTPQRAIRAIEIEAHYATHPEEARLADRSRATRREAVVIGLEIGREERRRRISERLRQRLDEGMIGEVERLLAEGVPAENLIYYGLEYKFLTLHCLGRLGRQEMELGLETAIHQFAKRQMTWFRGMERRGHRIHWLPYDMPDAEFLQRAGELLEENRAANAGHGK